MIDKLDQFAAAALHVLALILAFGIFAVVFLAVKQQEKRERRRSSEQLMRHVNREYPDGGVR